MYEYGFELLRVVDGDTIDVRLDLGFEIEHRLRVRLKGINTPELHSKDVSERAKAAAAKGVVENALRTASAVKAQTEKPTTDDKYGRWLATIFYRTTGTTWVNLNEQLIKEGHATPYDGKGPKT